MLRWAFSSLTGFALEKRRSHISAQVDVVPDFETAIDQREGNRNHLCLALTDLELLSIGTQGAYAPEFDIAMAVKTSRLARDRHSNRLSSFDNFVHRLFLYFSQCGQHFVSTPSLMKV
jgi:hypothetical protein